LRKVIIATVLALFALTAVASAAGGTGADSGSVTYSSNKAGTKQKPHPIKYTLKIDTTATGSTLPQVTREVKLKIYGMKVDGKHFATCSLNAILNAKNDAVCPKKALVGSGSIMAILQGATINYPVSTTTGLLYHETLTFTSQTAKVKGKKYVSQAVTGCKGGKRPWQLQVITAPLSAGKTGPGQTSTVNGSSSCSK
jgi:hypothetical protein